MKAITRILPWKVTLVFSLLLLPLLIAANFYGLYTDKFYFLKPDNYIFPLLSIFHFVFLYALWFKISENEFADIQMRNIEYALYFVLFIYLFKLLDSVTILVSKNQYTDYIFPENFTTYGIILISSYAFLIVLTLVAFMHRKTKVGNYQFDYIGENIDSM